MVIASFKDATDKGVLPSVEFDARKSRSEMQPERAKGKLTS
jgi:hypothetical protein